MKKNEKSTTETTSEVSTESTVGEVTDLAELPTAVINDTSAAVGQLGVGHLGGPAGINILNQAIAPVVFTPVELTRESLPASAYRHADPFHHDCPGCGFDLALPAFKTKAGLQVVECCRCNTVFCPDAKSDQAAFRSALADQFAKLKAGDPHLIEMPIRVTQDFATIERSQIFEEGATVLLTVGGIVLAARDAGYEIVDSESPTIVLRKPEAK
jgi:hypothetical protein